MSLKEEVSNEKANARYSIFELGSINFVINNTSFLIKITFLYQVLTLFFSIVEGVLGKK